MGGILLHDVNAVGLGLAEDFTTAILPAGTYTVRVGGSENRAQMYALTLAVADSNVSGLVQGTAVTEDPNFRVAGLRFHGASISEIVV